MKTIAQAIFSQSLGFGDQYETALPMAEYRCSDKEHSEIDARTMYTFGDGSKLAFKRDKVEVIG